MLDNKGMDIKGKSGANARAIFDGEVSVLPFAASAFLRASSALRRASSSAQNNIPISSQALEKAGACG